METKIIDLTRAFKELVEQKLGPVEVIIYGSRARGDNDPDSDLDLCVIVDRMDDQSMDIVFDCAWEIGFEPGIVISTVIFTKEEIAGALKESPLYLTVQQEGVRV